MLGVIGGVAFSESKMLEDANKEEIETKYGVVTILISEKIAFIPRHDMQSKTPPHKINHQANISGFKKRGITKIIGVNSVGSLKPEISPPSVLIPHDYINMSKIPTYFHDEIVHIIPGLDEGLRDTLISLAQKFEFPVIDKGVYVQTTGPRLETKAEIRMLADYGDVVGMTMASEATLAKELELSYACICSVDNFAHGLVDEPLTSKTIIENARANRERIGDFFSKLLRSCNEHSH
jgi:5'-methylthioadenosine phosphorylase